MKVLIGPNLMGLQEALPELEEKYPQVTFAYCADWESLPEAIADADVYMGWLREETFEAAEKLQWIQAPSTGVDGYLAIPGMLARDVYLTNARGTHAACLAESAMGMILAFTRGIWAGIAHQRAHTWANREIRPQLVELTGSTMGIVGFGSVGRALATRACPFDMRILAVDLYPKNKPDYVSALWDVERLEDLLRAADYVVVTVPRTAETRHMIGAAQLAVMKPTAIIVGISRGGVIDEAALAQALREDRLRAAALDVTDPEPLPEDDELWDLDNLLITPHIAGGTQHETAYILNIFRENLDRFLDGEFPLRNQIDKERGF
jgi:phosphoglycerate dehydrogenase-like enzyme